VFVDNIDNCFPPDSEINIFRIVQEGFNNVIKHSGASSAVFMISKEDSGVCITIEDNGKGFSPASTGNAKNDYAGFGLTGINERSRILGGVCEINSTPGKGSVLKIRLPVRDYEKRNAHVNPGE